MSDQDEDQSVLNQIQRLVTEEHQLYALGARGTSSGTDWEQLAKIQVELDQCWDLINVLDCYYFLSRQRSVHHPEHMIGPAVGSLSINGC